MTFIVHHDLLHFDLRRPYSEWPETVRKLIKERQAAARAAKDGQKRKKVKR